MSWKIENEQQMKICREIVPSEASLMYDLWFVLSVEFDGLSSFSPFLKSRENFGEVLKLSFGANRYCAPLPYETHKLTMPQNFKFLNF